MWEFTAALWNVSWSRSAHQCTELLLALILSTLIGWERGSQQKSAGLRTHALVGVASALMMQVSQHGFTDVLGLYDVDFDPTRVAAQIVSGIGFIGGGLIFVRRDAVRGLTTAATIWMTCAIGIACGGGLALLAVATTTLHFLVVRGYPFLAGLFSRSPATTQPTLRLTYRTGQTLLRRLMEECTQQGFHILQVRADVTDTAEPGPDVAGEEVADEEVADGDVTDGKVADGVVPHPRTADRAERGGESPPEGTARVMLRLDGREDRTPRLTAALFRMQGVLSVDLVTDPRG